MEKYETIIIGAGPGGLHCAQKLAAAGRQVLVIEQKEIIGPKICGGGLTTKIMDLGIPKDLVEYFFHKPIQYTPYQRVVVKTKEPSIATISRERLGQWMASEAQKQGAILEIGMRVTKINDNSVMIGNREIKFDYLIGADGSNSIVRRSLNIPMKKIGIGMHYITKQKFKYLKNFFDNKYFASGYAWIFPYRNYTSIGVYGSPESISASELRSNFHKWLKQKNIDVADAKFEAASINCDYRGYKFDNMFLVGDAAGFTSSLTGEGMYFAMVTGAEVAKLIIDPEYKPLKIDQLLRVKRRHETLARIIESAGVIRPVCFELFTFLLRNNTLRHKILKAFV
ncbi:MAG: NAD(P)/FAD-dependent oxidoreductase [bacterium]